MIGLDDFPAPKSYRLCPLSLKDCSHPVCADKCMLQFERPMLPEDLGCVEEFGRLTIDPDKRAPRIASFYLGQQVRTLRPLYRRGGRCDAGVLLVVYVIEVSLAGHSLGLYDPSAMAYFANIGIDVVEPVQ